MYGIELVNERRKARDGCVRERMLQDNAVAEWLECAFEEIKSILGFRSVRNPGAKKFLWQSITFACSETGDGATKGVEFSVQVTYSLTWSKGEQKCTAEEKYCGFLRRRALRIVKKLQDLRKDTNSSAWVLPAVLRGLGKNNLMFFDMTDESCWVAKEDYIYAEASESSKRRWEGNFVDVETYFITATGSKKK